MQLRARASIWNVRQKCIDRTGLTESFRFLLGGYEHDAQFQRFSTLMVLMVRARFTMVASPELIIVIVTAAAAAAAAVVVVVVVFVDVGDIGVQIARRVEAR